MTHSTAGGFYCSILCWQVDMSTTDSSIRGRGHEPNIIIYGCIVDGCIVRRAHKPLRNNTLLHFALSCYSRARRLLPRMDSHVTVRAWHGCVAQTLSCSTLNSNNAAQRGTVVIARSRRSRLTSMHASLSKHARSHRLTRQKNARVMANRRR